MTAAPDNAFNNAAGVTASPSLTAARHIVIVVPAMLSVAVVRNAASLLFHTMIAVFADWEYVT